MDVEDGGAKTPGFDFEQFFRQAKEGRTVLLARKEKLESEIEEGQAELEKIADQLSQLEQIIGSDPSVNERTRQSNVQNLVLAAVKEIFEDPNSGYSKHVAERQIVARVMLKEPTTKEKSIQSVLLRMHKGGKLARHGKRGSYEYTLIVPGDEIEPKVPHGEAADHTDKVVETIAQKADGATEKDLAWAVGDLAIVHPILRTLIDRGAVQETEEGGEKVYRIVSKEDRAPRTMFDAELPT